MFVGQRMTKNPVTVHLDTPVSEAQFLMRKEKVHRFPVVDKNNRLQGIVTEKDLLYAAPSPASTLDVYEMTYLLSKLKVEEVMTGQVFTVTEDTPVEDAARIMADNNIGGLPVMKGSDMVGIITESDLFRVFLEMLGSREKGIRLTLDVPEEKGELAKLTKAISEAGGNIVALGTFLGPKDCEGVVTIKVQDLTQKEVENAVGPFVNQIVDIRT